MNEKHLNAAIEDGKRIAVTNLDEAAARRAARSLVVGLTERHISFSLASNRLDFPDSGGCIKFLTGPVGRLVTVDFDIVL